MSATSEEVNKILLWVNHANNIINDYFGRVTSFDVLICRGSWEMEVQVISRKSHSTFYLLNDTRSVGITDYRLREIVIRYDIARFGHYLHELIHGVVSDSHPHQLREGFAWYFTLKLTERCKYVRPPYPSWIDVLYIYPVKRLAEILGDDFLKDLTVGQASLQSQLLPRDIQDLFLPEDVFYAKNRYLR